MQLLGKAFQELLHCHELATLNLRNRREQFVLISRAEQERLVSTTSHNSYKGSFGKSDAFDFDFAVHNGTSSDLHVPMLPLARFQSHPRFQCSPTSELTGTHRQGAARRMLFLTPRGALPLRVRVDRPEPLRGGLPNPAGTILCA
jgi:hypothetical protein